MIHPLVGLRVAFDPSKIDREDHPEPFRVPPLDGDGPMVLPPLRPTGGTLRPSGGRVPARVERCLAAAGLHEGRRRDRFRLDPQPPSGKLADGQRMKLLAFFFAAIGSFTIFPLALAVSHAMAPFGKSWFGWVVFAFGLACVLYALAVEKDAKKAC